MGDRTGYPSRWRRGRGTCGGPTALRLRRSRLPGALVAAAAAVFGVAGGSSPAGALAASAAPLPSSVLATLLTRVSVSPDRALLDGQQVEVRVSGGSYGTTYEIVECGPKALLLLTERSANLEDGCDSRHAAVVTVGAGGQAAASMHLPAVLTTALGAADCRGSTCFLALDALHSTGGASILVAQLHFASNACAAPGSCATPADAWDPSLGAPPAVRPAAPGPATKAPGPVQAPTVVALQPVPAGDLTAPGAVTGPFDGQALTPAPTAPAPTAPAPTAPGPAAGTGSSTSTSTGTSIAPGTSTTLTGTATTTVPTTAASTTVPGTVQGEGLLRLALAAPGTSWGPGVPSSTVVDATLTDLTTHQVGAAQQFVLFYGASPFVYAGFAGPVRTSDRYEVTISVERGAAQGGLSQPGPGQQPRVKVLASALEVVSPANPQYLAYAYAPVMYGRSTSALHDVPLLTYAGVTPAAQGAHVLSYVIVWSHEDAGTGILPFVEWGRWGRMTDIENAISFTVSSAGAVSKATYLWGGETSRSFPDSQTSLREVDEPFTGTWSGHHPVLRDATGNNDFSDQGTTRFRFQMAPVAAPGPGQARDAVMDANPFTYQVMADEVARWYADLSTTAATAGPGQAEQYAIVDLNTGGKGVSSVAVDLHLKGRAQWFRSDLGWGFPLVGSGHVRTVVKLPVGWAGSQVDGVEVAVEPPSAARTVTVRSLEVEQFTGSAVVRVPVPRATVVPEALAVAAPG